MGSCDSGRIGVAFGQHSEFPNQSQQQKISSDPLVNSLNFINSVCGAYSLVGEEGGAQDHGEADCEHGAHEAAIDDGVDAVLLPPARRALPAHVVGAAAAHALLIVGKDD